MLNKKIVLFLSLFAINGLVVAAEVATAAKKTPTEAVMAFIKSGEPLSFEMQDVAQEYEIIEPKASRSYRYTLNQQGNAYKVSAKQESIVKVPGNKLLANSIVGEEEKDQYVRCVRYYQKAGLSEFPGAMRVTVRCKGMIPLFDEKVEREIDKSLQALLAIARGEDK